MKQTWEQKLSGAFVAFAFLLLAVQLELPHHHHGEQICFSPTCTHLCDCPDEHQHDSPHAAHSEDCHCHHTPHAHDNCFLYAPFVTDNSHRDLVTQLSLAEDATPAEVIHTQLLIVVPAVAISRTCAPPPPKLCHSPAAIHGLRAPPAC